MAPRARRAAGRHGAARCGAGCLRDAQVGLARAAGAWAGLKHVGPEKAAKLAIPATPDSRTPWLADAQNL